MAKPKDNPSTATITAAETATRTVTAAVTRVPQFVFCAHCGFQTSDVAQSACTGCADNCKLVGAF